MKEGDIRAAIFISGSGTTAEAVIRACQEGMIERIQPIAVVSSRPDAKGLVKAEKLGVPTHVVQRKHYETPEDFGDALLKLLKNLDVDFISQNGWLVFTPCNVVSEYPGRIINQHPGPLDPGGGIGKNDRGYDFGGRGMYGARVICSRLAYSWVMQDDYWTEATVHFVTEDDEYDQGDIIRVGKYLLPAPADPVTIAELWKNPDELMETTMDVQQKLLPLEHENVVETLKMFATSDTVSGWRRKERLIPIKNKPVVEQAKDLATKLFPHG
ncbi:hypothetical protein HYT33_04170 [Candidatus Roizmanbacteria bacterium]|nr:hypothetical protein [Candidatus Roizmanbacteria bacterium]